MGHPAQPHHEPATHSKVVVLLPPSEGSADPYHRVTLRADDFTYTQVGESRHVVLKVTEKGTKVAEFEAALGVFLLDNHQGG